MCVGGRGGVTTNCNALYILSAFYKGGFVNKVMRTVDSLKMEVPGSTSNITVRTIAKQEKVVPRISITREIALGNVRRVTDAAFAMTRRQDLEVGVVLTPVFALDRVKVLVLGTTRKENRIILQNKEVKSLECRRGLDVA